MPCHTGNAHDTPSGNVARPAFTADQLAKKMPAFPSCELTKRVQYALAGAFGARPVVQLILASERLMTHEVRRLPAVNGAAITRTAMLPSAAATARALRCYDRTAVPSGEMSTNAQPSTEGSS